MGSPARIAPPDGYELDDQPNAMRQGFGRLALSPGKLLDVGRTIGNAMSDIYGRIKRWENDPTLPSSRGDEDIGADAFALGPAMLSPGFGRAAGGLGAAGGRGANLRTPVARLLKTEDAQNAIRNAKASGMTDAQIAEHLNSYFRLEENTISPRALTGTRQRAEKSAWTPEMVNRLKALDETFAGTPNQNKTIISNFREMHPDYTGSDSTIQTMLYRQRAWGGVNEATGAESAAKSGGGGDFELGALGGSGHNSSPRVTAEDIRNWARESGVDVMPNSGEKGGHGSEYVKLKDPDNPPFNGVTQVRLGDHPGRPARPDEYGRYFDVGGSNYKPTDKHMPDPATAANAGGGLYGEPENIADVLKWRFSKAPPGESWLVGPDKAPSVQSPARDIRAQATNVPGTVVDPDPRQLKLLSGGLPPGFVLDEPNDNAMRAR